MIVYVYETAGLKGPWDTPYIPAEICVGLCRSHASPGPHQSAETLSSFKAQTRQEPLPSLHDSLSTDDVVHHCTEIVNKVPMCAHLSESEVVACPVELTLLEECVDDNNHNNGKLVHKDATSDSSVQEYSSTCFPEMDTGTPNEQAWDSLEPKELAIGFRNDSPSFANSQLYDGAGGVVGEPMANKGTNQVVLSPQAPIADDLAVQMDELLVDRPEINESVAAGFPESCHRAVRCMIHAAKLAVQVTQKFHNSLLIEIDKMPALQLVV